jgi:hypothetical protein
LQKKDTNGPEIPSKKAFDICSVSSDDSDDENVIII